MNDTYIPRVGHWVSWYGSTAIIRGEIDSAGYCFVECIDNDEWEAANVIGLYYLPRHSLEYDPYIITQEAFHHTPRHRAR